MQHNGVRAAQNAHCVGVPLYIARRTRRRSCVQFLWPARPPWVPMGRSAIISIPYIVFIVREQSQRGCVFLT